MLYAYQQTYMYVRMHVCMYQEIYMYVCMHVCFALCSTGYIVWIVYAWIGTCEVVCI